MSTQVTPPPTLKPGPGQLHYSLAQVALAQSDLTAIGQYMFWLMFRNVSSDGLVFESPPDPGSQRQGLRRLVLLCPYAGR
jgi:hypothetical protein